MKNIATADGIQVRCSYDAIVPIGELKLHPDNPNKHPPLQLELFSEIIKYQGFRRAPTVSKRSGFITRGNGLVESCRIAGLTQVPVDFQDYDSEEQELADVLADNELAKYAQLDEKRTGEILERLNGRIDMKVTGFRESRIADLLSQLTRRELTLNLPVNGVLNDAAPPPPLAPLAQTKMVQLFLSTDSYPEFERITAELQKRFGTTNLTDTVLEGLRHAVGKAIAPAVPVSEG